jgi:hypothetical protein
LWTGAGGLFNDKIAQLRFTDELITPYLGNVRKMVTRVKNLTKSQHMKRGEINFLIFEKKKTNHVSEGGEAKMDLHLDLK